MKDILVSFPDPCSENWAAMEPRGCNRHCATCATTVHDLEHYTPEELDALITRSAKVCVRARIDNQGQVKTRPGRKGTRLVALVGAGLGLAAAGQPLAAKPAPTTGTIEGVVEDGAFDATVEARSADGSVYTADARRGGKFKLKRLPAGTYDISYKSNCGDPKVWSGGKVVVEPGKVTRTTTQENYICIVVGMIERHDTAG